MKKLLTHSQIGNGWVISSHTLQLRHVDEITIYLAPLCTWWFSLSRPQLSTTLCKRFEDSYQHIRFYAYTVEGYTFKSLLPENFEFLYMSISRGHNSTVPLFSHFSALAKHRLRPGHTALYGLITAKTRQKVVSREADDVVRVDVEFKTSNSRFIDVAGRGEKSERRRTR